MRATRRPRPTARWADRSRCDPAAPLATIPFACDCGTLTGELHVASLSGSHVACHCADCRATALYHDRPWDQAEGVAVWHTTPDHVRISSGAERLAAIRVKPRGFLRWFASCCGTPLGASTDTAAVPFFGLRTSLLEDDGPLGPRVAEAYLSRTAPRHRGYGRLVRGVVLRALLARLSLRRRNPFLDATGGPAGPVHVLSDRERAVLYE